MAKNVATIRVLTYFSLGVKLSFDIINASKTKGETVPKLPVISGRECIKALQRAGFEISKQKGSHVKLRRGGTTVIVPDHKELDRGTLGSILEQAGIDSDRFNDLLSR